MKLPFLPAVLILVLLAAWSPGQDAKPEVIEEFDVARDGDALVLPGMVNGKPARFLLDTGASGFMFDRTLLRGKSQKTVEVFLPKGTAHLDLFDPPTARVGAQVLSFSGPVVGADLQKMRDVSGYDISGVLGMQFLGSHIIQIDFDRGKVILYKTLPKDVGTPVNLIVGKGDLMEIWGTLDGWVQEPFIVDTGYVGTHCGLLSHGTFTGTTFGGSMKVVHETLSLTAGGITRCEVGRARRLTVGDFAIAGPIFVDSGSNNLDTGFLSRFLVTFDFPKRVMYLKKGRRFDEPDRVDISGLHLIRSAGKTVIHSVDKDSPAAKGGLHGEDVILKIARKDAGTASLFQLRRLLSTADKEVHVTVQRGDHRIDATLVLEQPAGGR